MLRLMIYDRTCVGQKLRIGLSTAWSAGSSLYKGLGRLDAAYGATSWLDALGWLARHEEGKSIREVQYWGHGRWGRVYVDRDVLDASAFTPGHALHGDLETLKSRFTKDGLFWLRTCESFGARAGHDFASRLADQLGVRVAGHTHIIGALQSGLRGLSPGASPDWPLEEGIAEGTPDAPVRAHGSGVLRPRTITFLDGAVPDGWITP